MEARMTFSCGALSRRSVRAMLDYEGVQWTEHKGFLRSSFVVRGTRPQIDLLHKVIAEWQRKMEGER